MKVGIVASFACGLFKEGLPFVNLTNPPLGQDIFAQLTRLSGYEATWAAVACLAFAIVSVQVVALILRWH
jgi:hypothetical protein